MYDFHVHTRFSDDCSIDMESYIAPAIEKGLKGICFTDHIDIDYPCNEIKFQLDYCEYINEIEKLKNKYAGKIEILKGIEFGMQPHILESDQSFFQNRNFDYIIGSIHVAGKKELYGGDFLLNRSEHEGIVEYFEDMIYCVKNFKSYSNLGHLDAISRYVSKGSYKLGKYLDYIEEVLRILVESGKGIEINTSGKRYGLGSFHPEPAVVKLYKDMSGEIVTIGSDSHNPSTLGYGFDEAKNLLFECGFKYYSIFKDGKAEFIKL